MPPLIRPETPDDAEAIRQLTQLALAGLPFAAGDEQDVPGRLRARGRLTVSLVTIGDGGIIGHAAFSRMWRGPEPTEWYALGPLSVAPAAQKTGIGGALVRAGLTDLKAAGAEGVVLTGNPAYYHRFGFVVRPDLAPPGEPAAYFQVLAFGSQAPPADLTFDRAFYS
ncbi:MAG: GNAT family N-acetyltransferase [Caulobacterales bacterium]